MLQGLQAMKDSAAILVYWDGEATDISWPEPCIEENVTNGQGGINSLSKGTIDAMMADKNTSIYDLIGIGTVGLIKGIDSFSPDKNVRLTTYIAKCAENEILMYF